MTPLSHDDVARDYVEALHLWQTDRDGHHTAHVFIPWRYQQDSFRLRSLRHLVSSVPDSLVFDKPSDTIITFRQQHFDDVPWYNDTGKLILRFFSEELLGLIPGDEWHLGLRYTNWEEIEAEAGAEPFYEAF